MFGRIARPNMYRDLPQDFLAAYDVDALLHLAQALAGEVEDGVIDH